MDRRNGEPAFDRAVGKFDWGLAVSLCELSDPMIPRVIINNFAFRLLRAAKASTSAKT